MKAPSSRREYERRMQPRHGLRAGHLAEDLTLERMALVAAFSPFHFHRVFAAITGETVSDFIRRVRLERAAGALISLPETNILDIAFRYGFSSAATFARAFRAHFGMSATHWRSGGRQHWHELLQRGQVRGKPKRNPSQTKRKNRKAAAKRIGHHASVNQKGFAMRVEIREMPSYRIAYMRHIRSVRYERRHLRFVGQSEALDTKPRPAACQAAMVGIGHDAPSIVASEKLRYDAGVVVGSDFKPDRAVNVTDLPGGKYAVARFQGSAAVITDAWARLYTVWLPASGYETIIGRASNFAEITISNFQPITCAASFVCRSSRCEAAEAT